MLGQEICLKYLTKMKLAPLTHPSHSAAPQGRLKSPLDKIIDVTALLPVRRSSNCLHSENTQTSSRRGTLEATLKHTTFRT
jgi:hypothetical protein